MIGSELFCSEASRLIIWICSNLSFHGSLSQEAKIASCPGPHGPSISIFTDNLFPPTPSIFAVNQAVLSVRDSDFGSTLMKLIAFHGADRFRGFIAHLLCPVSSVQCPVSTARNRSPPTLVCPLRHTYQYLKIDEIATCVLERFRSFAFDAMAMATS